MDVLLTAKQRQSLMRLIKNKENCFNSICCNITYKLL